MTGVWVRPTRCAWGLLPVWRVGGLVLAQAHSLRMGAPSGVAGRGAGSGSRPLVAHGGSFRCGGSGGWSWLTPTRCAWGLLPVWRVGGLVLAHAHSLRTAVPPSGSKKRSAWVYDMGYFRATRPRDLDTEDTLL